VSTLAAPPRPPRSRRPFGWPRLSRDPETRSAQVGVGVTLLVHALLLLTLPAFLRREASTGAWQAGARERTFDIDLETQPEATLATPPAPAPKPFNFVEVNPDAPDNPPDKTENFGAQNQQVAQEKPTPDGKSDTPALEGDKEKQSTAIVSGRLQQLEPPAPPEPDPDQRDPVDGAVAEAAPRPAEAPLPGFEKVEGDATDSIGSNIAKLPPPNALRGPETVDGDAQVRDVVSFNGQVVRIDPRRPQDRERVPQRNSRPAFLRDNPLGTQNIGPIAYNAKWSEYGAYLQKLIETVQIQWERIIVQSHVYPPQGTMVRVTFVLNDKGEITDIAAAESDAPLQAKKSCVSAITARSPYGRWSEDMVAVLGKEQELTFSFYYQ
jgi:hypothetical protein